MNGPTLPEAIDRLRVPVFEALDRDHDLDCVADPWFNCTGSKADGGSPPADFLQQPAWRRNEICRWPVSRADSKPTADGADAARQAAPVPPTSLGADGFQPVTGDPLAPRGGAIARTLRHAARQHRRGHTDRAVRGGPIGLDEG